MQSDVFVETDVLCDFLVTGQQIRSALRTLVRLCVCYTSVLNATELLAAASHEMERSIVRNLLNGVRVLGFHQRYAETFAQIFSNQKEKKNVITLRSSMIAGMCLQNKLTLVTYRISAYNQIDGLTLLPAHQINDTQNWSDLEQCITPPIGKQRTLNSTNQG